MAYPSPETILACGTAASMTLGAVAAVIYELRRQHNLPERESREWAKLAKRRVNAALARRDVTYDELAKRLTDMGLPETEGSVQVKINRGTFPAWFMLAVMRAVGAHTLHVK